MKRYLAIVGLLLTVNGFSQTSTSDVWINEFHYDQRTMYGEMDTNEFVEIAMKTTIASNPVELAKYKLILYTSGAYDPTAWNLGKGLPYNVSSSWYSEAETVHALNSFQSCLVSGTSFTLLSKQLPILQDVPAAFALVYENTVIQLLSYEKAFKIGTAAQNAGPAAGMTTTLITTQNGTPAMETANTLANHSVSLLGTGTSYNNFYWSDDSIVAVMATPCAPNTNTVTTQSFQAPLPVRWLSLAARGVKETIYVDWKVATETGVAKYVVEVADVNGTFTTTADMPFSASKRGNYQQNISGLQPGTYRVRVKTLMQNGEVEYSENRMVKLTAGSIQFVSVFPNPVRNGVANVSLIPSEKAVYTIEVVDMNGKRISSVKTAMLQPNTLNKIDVPMQVAPGVYQLKINSTNDQQTIKVVVM